MSPQSQPSVRVSQATQSRQVEQDRPGEQGALVESRAPIEQSSPVGLKEPVGLDEPIQTFTQPAVLGQRIEPGQLGAVHERVPQGGGRGPVHLVRLAGELDYATSSDLRAAISSALESRPAPSAVEVDLSQVTFLDSTGLGTLVVGYRICADLGVRLTVRDPSPFAAKVLEVSGVGDRLIGAGTPAGAPHGRPGSPK